ncbi:MAG: DMT family transporter [Dongiaceae bacterium]
MTRSEPHSVRGAVLCMACAMLFFSMLNASMKYIGLRYPYPEVLWVRYAGHSLYALIVFLPGWGTALFRTARPRLQVLRTLLLFGASGCYFLGLVLIPLPTASALTFIGPILVAALGVPLLGERVGPRRWAAILVGFAGALIIVRPGVGTVQWGAVLVLIEAVFYAFYQVMSRKVGMADPAPVSITLAGLGGLALTTLLLPFGEIRAPASWTDAAVFATAGLWGFLGHFLVIKAYQGARAAIVAPIGYGELIGATILGWVIFREFPDLWSWVGAAVIVASGLYVVLREDRLRRGAARG